MPEDDDLNYTLLALQILEQHGADFTSDDVATAWLLDLPARAGLHRGAGGLPQPAGRVPAAARRRGSRNPFREWIGAQIRTDLYGWVNPGDAAPGRRDGPGGTPRSATPATASTARCSWRRMARTRWWRTTSRTVLDVGTVGGAAAQPAGPGDRARRGSWRAAGRRPDRGVRAAARRSTPTCTGCTCSTTRPCMAYALAAGQRRLRPAICLTVMGGWDTDSYGATAGAVAGALAVPRPSRQRWSAPLRNRLMHVDPGLDGLSFDASPSGRWLCSAAGGAGLVNRRPTVVEVAAGPACPSRRCPGCSTATRPGPTPRNGCGRRSPSSATFPTRPAGLLKLGATMQIAFAVDASATRCTRR